MATEFCLRVSVEFYTECNDIPAARESILHPKLRNDKLGIVEVFARFPDRLDPEHQSIYVYFDTQENMMNFQLRYL
jgi:hypothetical protein